MQDRSKYLAIIGEFDVETEYIDRPTVKCLIFNNDNKVLIINNGLLAGGGMEAGESETDTLVREVVEEVGMVLTDIYKLGTIIQYRNFLGKRYVVHGYKAKLDRTLGYTNPQDEAEANFSWEWYDINQAAILIDDEIARYEQNKVLSADSEQGKLFNYKTTRVFLQYVIEQDKN